MSRGGLVCCWVSGAGAAEEMLFGLEIAFNPDAGPHPVVGSVAQRGGSAVAELGAAQALSAGSELLVGVKPVAGAFRAGWGQRGSVSLEVHEGVLYRETGLARRGFCCQRPYPESVAPVAGIPVSAGISALWAGVELWCRLAAVEAGLWGFRAPRGWWCLCPWWDQSDISARLNRADTPRGSTAQRCSLVRAIGGYLPSNLHHPVAICSAVPPSAHAEISLSCHLAPEQWFRSAEALVPEMARLS